MESRPTTSSSGRHHFGVNEVLMKSDVKVALAALVGLAHLPYILVRDFLEC